MFLEFNTGCNSKILINVNKIVSIEKYGTGCCGINLCVINNETLVCETVSHSYDDVIKRLVDLGAIPDTHLI